MFKLTAYSVVILHVCIAFFTPITAAPTDVIIPGPGMPTLESLNLTTADLFNTHTLEQLEPSLAAATTCRGVNMADNNDVVTCFNYIYAIGTRTCGSNRPTGDNTLICNMGTALVVIFNDGLPGPWSSYW